MFFFGAGEYKFAGLAKILEMLPYTEPMFMRQTAFQLWLKNEFCELQNK